MNPSTKRVLFPILAIVVLLTACAPTPAATQDPALVQQLIEQSVALTVAAQNAQTSEAQSLVVIPTNTPLPTQTEAAPPAPTLELPTATPFVIVPPTNPVVSGGGGGTVPTAKPNYACDIIRRRPYDNTIYRPNEDFDIKWTIVNTGVRSLRAGLDVSYYSGTQMTTTTFVEMPELKPGGQYEFILDAKAPSKAGFYAMTWSVEGNLCYPYVAIYVEK